MTLCLMTRRRDNVYSHHEVSIGAVFDLDERVISRGWLWTMQIGHLPVNYTVVSRAISVSSAVVLLGEKNYDNE